jgi:putative DNA methylase
VDEVSIVSETSLPIDRPRLIERAFPLKQASLDSVHEKNVRHGHISTLHIWPARRPLAACRAALIATLLPDPGTPEERRKLCEKIAGKVVQKIEKKKMPNGRTVERIKEETEGGILHWKRETENPETLAWFRQEIRKSYGGSTPRVLDPFAGGGAIPIEAMRLGCEVTAVDINPVAWFILKCTLEYPQKLAGKTHPLPDFILDDEEFMAAFYKAHPSLVGETKRTKRQANEFQNDLIMKDKPDSGRVPEADLAWHVRAWGKRVLDRARRELAKFYPMYADFEPLKPGKTYEKQPMRLVPLKDDGTPDVDSLNAEFSEEYLGDPRNPRWVAKPTVAYLWARTVTCKNCRATVPLLKTRWLCKKANKRVLLTMAPNADRTGVDFGFETKVPGKGGNAAQKREHDKRIGEGTMSRAGAKCPCCGLPSMTMEDIRAESNAGRSSLQVMAVVTEESVSKEYRSPTDLELQAICDARQREGDVLGRLSGHSLDETFEPTSTRSISAQLYGVRQWRALYTPRQRLSLGTLGLQLHNAAEEIAISDLPESWREAITDAICLSLDRLACFMCVNTRWKTDADSMTDAFSRFSISLLWDFAEANPLGTTAGGFVRCNDRIATAYDTLLAGLRNPQPATVLQLSAGEFASSTRYDLVITDPPYYQAVSYADLSDFFYTWLRGFEPRALPQFEPPLTEKYREFVQHIRRDKSREEEKHKYEGQMAEAFRKARATLTDDGRFVCVFAHKEPDAWETLVSAIINSGFVVTGSWPVQTEMPSRQRGAGVAALASSVWLVCRPRAATVRPGWDNKVLEEMRANIATRLREFWDAGIRGPDFVWAATGPALEAYSKHPVVKKANDPGKTMEVGEFLSHVRRMVVDFVVGQVLTSDGAGADLATADRMDAPTAYYLLHRHDFGLEEAPSGACILYATACGLSDHELEATWDLLVRTGGSGGREDDDEEDEDADPDAEADPDSASDSGSRVKLKTWVQRKHGSMGYEAPGGQPVPLIDRIHRLMHLWRAGDVLKVDEYLDEHGLRRHELFRRLLQSLIELSPARSDERSLLESLSNHVGAKGAKWEAPQAPLPLSVEE